MRNRERDHRRACLSAAVPEPNDRDRLRCVTLARIETDDGAVGWGECISQWPDSAVAVRTVVEQGLAPLLIGADPRDPRRLWERMRDQTFWYGRGGIASFAISALDCAIWDLAGRLAGVPVHRLLGGAVHDRFRACASIIWDPGDLDWTTREFAGYAEQGFTAAKGGWGRDPATAFGTDGRRDEACVRAVREAVGPDFGLACDVSGRVRWTARHAVAMARRLEPYDLMWLEDALPPEDYEGWRKLSAAAPMPIATAERDWTVEDYRHRMDYAPVDILLVDPGRVEGVTGMWLIAQDAASRGVGVVPHVVQRPQHRRGVARAGHVPDDPRLRAEATPLAHAARARGRAVRPRRRLRARARSPRAGLRGRRGRGAPGT